MRVTCLVHLILHGLITLIIIFCEEYKLFSSSLCNFLKPVVIYSEYKSSEFLDQVSNYQLFVEDAIELFDYLFIQDILILVIDSQAFILNLLAVNLPDF
jgi:hypothetical protein